MFCAKQKGDSECRQNILSIYPGLDLSEDDFAEHPYTIPSVILSSSYTDNDGQDHMMGDAYQFVLADKIHQFNGWNRVRWSDLGYRFYYAAHREYLKSKIYNTDDVNALREEFESQQKEFEDEIRSAEDAAYSAIEDEERVQKQLDEAKNTIHRLNAKIESLQNWLENTQGQEAVAVPIPDTYGELPRWVEENFPGKMILHSRAIRSLKEAEFEDVHLVYKSLELLGNDYYRMRAGSITRKQFDEKCQALGVTESGSITDNRAGEERKDYFVAYNGRDKMMDRHLKNGSAATRDPKRCMRIYFFWDEDMQQVVICHLPQHLPIRSS